MAARLVVALLAACSHGFSDDDIKQAEADIRHNYEKQGFKVTDVALIRDGASHLTGYVQIEKKIIGQKVKVQLQCSAKMDSEGGRYLWSCGQQPP